MQIRWKALALGTITAAVLAPVKFDLGPIPITLQTLVLFTLAGALGKNTGFLIGLTYLILGGIGLPVFAGFQGGWHKLIGPTAGFLWAFPPICYFVGWSCQSGSRDFFHFPVYFFRAHLILLIPGFLVLYLLLPGAHLWDALVRLLPGLVIKSIVGGLLALWLIKKLPPGWTEASLPVK